MGNTSRKEIIILTNPAFPMKPHVYDEENDKWTSYFPTFNIKNISLTPVYLRGDEDSVYQYCQDFIQEKDIYVNDDDEENISYSWANSDSFETEKQRFSKDGALYYQYYEEYDEPIDIYDINDKDKEGDFVTEYGQWRLEYGFNKIVTSLTYNFAAAT